jgi:hypothetical protein
MNDNFDRWIDFLDPENLKGHLISSALYIAVYESFTDYVIDEVKFFFNTGFNENGFTFSDSYEKSVLTKDKRIINASLLWLKEITAISESDIETFNEIRSFRNKLTHELMDLLFKGLPPDFPQKFADLIALRIKIERWWILNVEIPTNPDSENLKNIEEKDIITGSEMIYRIIMDMLTNDEKTANYYRNEFQKYRFHKN